LAWHHSSRIVRAGDFVRLHGMPSPLASIARAAACCRTHSAVVWCLLVGGSRLRPLLQFSECCWH
jgi:hypothetical protein